MLKHSLTAALGGAVLLAAPALMPPDAAAAPIVAPSVESNALQAQRRCHHYRWSSRSHCTSERAVRQYLAPRRPPDYYYYGPPTYARPAYAYPFNAYPAPYIYQRPYPFYRYGFRRYHPWY